MAFIFTDISTGMVVANISDKERIITAGHMDLQRVQQGGLQ